MFRIKRSNLLQSKEFWNEMTLPPLNNVSHLFRGGRVIQYGASGDTELFEKHSNINGFWLSDSKISCL